MGSRGEWEEFSPDLVKEEIRRRAGNPDLSQASETSNKVRLLFVQKRDDIISILRTAKGKHDDQFLGKLIEEAENVKAFTDLEFVEYLRPSGKLWSRDTLAITQGLWTPPHISILVEVLSLRAPKLPVAHKCGPSPHNSSQIPPNTCVSFHNCSTWNNLD
jgi:hypothetical protein